jgi:hypothetical protein
MVNKQPPIQQYNVLPILDEKCTTDFFISIEVGEHAHQLEILRIKYFFVNGNFVVNDGKDQIDIIEPMDISKSNKSFFYFNCLILNFNLKIKLHEGHRVIRTGWRG